MTLLSITELLHHWKEWLNPQTIIAYGGLWLLLIFIFAETGLFVGFFLPGDSLLFVSGLAISTGLMDYSLFLVIILTTLAAIMGNFAGFYFGYSLGPRLFKKENSLIFKRRYLEMTQSFYERHGGPALILGRFIPIVRTFVPILAGAIKMNKARFALYNIVGALLWVPLMITSGYLLGNIPWVSTHVNLIVIGLVIITIIPVIRTTLRERRRSIKNEL